MTRINVIHPSQLCDEHLRAEWRELTRIPNGIAAGKLDPYNRSHLIPAAYTVQTADNPKGGKGHEYFFTDKLLWLRRHYLDIIRECKKRGFDKCTNRWPNDEVNNSTHASLWNDWEPTIRARLLNQQRIIERFPTKAHFHSRAAVITLHDLSINFKGREYFYKRSSVHWAESVQTNMKDMPVKLCEVFKGAWTHKGLKIQAKAGEES